MRRLKYITMVLSLLFVVTGCGRKTLTIPTLDTSLESASDNLQATISLEEETSYQEKEQEIYIVPEGQELVSRIMTPKGYKRIEASENSLLAYLRESEMKPDGSPVLLYDGSEKRNQSAQIAVFAIDVDNRDLQQCADSIMRVYAEYYWSIEEYDKISFHLTDGFLMEYIKWRDGNRLNINGNQTSWSKSGQYDNSYESFRKYLIQVFAYAGTLSLAEESWKIADEDIKVGDMFIKGGSPGHCVLIVDMAEDSDGNKCFLLAQGYMPAQEFHIINNPLHVDNPWYYQSELTYPLRTPEYTFPEGSLMRWGDFE